MRNNNSKNYLFALTEFRNIKTTNDINIWIYTMPIVDLKNKHSENYKVCKQLEKENNISIIAFHENLIGSFEEIKEWKDIAYVSFENKAIDCNNPKERTLLERLLLKDIQLNVDKNKFEVTGSSRGLNSVYVKKPLLYQDNVILKRKINFNINIHNDSSIIIGFDLSHSYDFINTLDKELHLIKKGDKVRDFYCNNTYEFVDIAPFTISDKNQYLGCSIIEYYKNKNQSYIVDRLDPNTRVALVSTKDKVIYPYIPSRLKRVCDKGNLPNNVSRLFDKHTKLGANEKMKFSIALLAEVLENSYHVKFAKKNMIAENLGYKVNSLTQPELLFKDGKTDTSISHGLQTHGPYESKEISISYFIDPSIANNKAKFEHIRAFTGELQKFSRRLGVVLKGQSANIDFKTIRIDNPDHFECDLRDIVKNYNHPTVIFMDDKNCTDKNYTSVKKVFGNRNNLATQFVRFATTNGNEKYRHLVFLNILLGVYGKNGVQPWILNKSLNADCYIGLDVSREGSINTAGVIQVVGKDGRVLKSKSIISSQAGEKINIETIRDIFYEAVSSYKDTYNESLKHIVFHRDGVSREELAALEETAKALDVKFDYVEITKDVNRRIATFNTSQGLWVTEIGRCYSKDDYAYIVSTNPHASIGMAKPLRIRKVFGEQNIDSIVEDVFYLSYMHIGSILKSRLPVTTYYADLSSTFGNRSLLPTNIDSNELHFI